MEPAGIALIAVAWVTTGVVTAIVMGRRGHDFAVWLALGSVLGPFIIQLAIERARFHGAIAAGSDSIETPVKRGFDVVAGIDGSAEALFGTITGRPIGASNVPVFVSPSSIDRERAPHADVRIGTGA